MSADGDSVPGDGIGKETSSEAVNPPINRENTSTENSNVGGEPLESGYLAANGNNESLDVTATPTDMNSSVTSSEEINVYSGNETNSTVKQATACEDNLHGLSIQDETDENKKDRVNPFNIEVEGIQTAPQTAETIPSKGVGNFLPLDSFGNDEIAGSFIQHSAGIADISLDDKNDGQSDPLQRKYENRPAFEPNGLDHSLNSSTSSSSDPWVKIAPDSPKTSSKPPTKAEEPITSRKEPNHVPQVQEPFLPSSVKKPPVIENNVPLSPLVLDIPGPCEPEDLIEGIIFSANYLGTTQLTSNRNPAKNARMFQAQEAVNRIKAPDGESQPTVEVDLFISTSKIKILNADTQETMMSHTLRSISYIADIGDLLVIMAKRHSLGEEQSPDGDAVMRKEQPKRHKIICHVLSSSDSHLIAESIGQCFNVAYQQFLQSNCIEPQNLTQADFSQLLDTQEMYHDDLVHYSKQENVKEIWVEKKKGEAMGIAIVESGWGSIIPTVILANLQHASPIERNGKFSIGDQIMAINGTSMVGLPLQTCHSIIKGLRNQTLVKFNIVSCPPVVSVLIKRPSLKHQLGFSVQDGIICSLMRGGIAERGGVRVGHRIIEINEQSVVATLHDKIVQMLVTSVGEIQMKTMPAAMYKLLTGLEQPIYL